MNELDRMQDEPIWYQQSMLDCRQKMLSVCCNHNNRNNPFKEQINLKLFNYFEKYTNELNVQRKLVAHTLLQVHNQARYKLVSTINNVNVNSMNNRHQYIYNNDNINNNNRNNNNNNNLEMSKKDLNLIDSTWYAIKQQTMDKLNQIYKQYICHFLSCHCLSLSVNNLTMFLTFLIHDHYYYYC